MRRIAVSALSLRPGAIGGAEFMVRNLVVGLSALSDVHTTVIAPADVDGWPSTVDVHRVSVRNRVLAENFQVPWMLRAAQVDAAIFPNYVTPLACLGVRSVTVIHDLLYRHFPEAFRRQKRIWLRCAHRVTVERASRIVAISDAVAADLTEVYGARMGHRLVTVPNPIDWARFDARGPDAHPLGGRPYFLSVAAEWPHKNVATLVRAFERMRPDAPGAALVLAGQVRGGLRGGNTRRGPSIADLVRQMGLEHDVLQAGHVSDAALGQWYRHARGFVFPSLFEGFGMPPVEALGMGVPVVTTRCAPILQATRNLAHHVRNPLDHQELARMLTEVFHEPERFAPSAPDVAALRAFYSPVRVARLYMDAAFN